MDNGDYKEVEQELKLEQKRGTLLSILCILTLIGAGIEIFSSLYSLGNLDVHLKSLQSTFDFLSSSGADETTLKLREAVRNEISVLSSFGKVGYIGKISANLLCLVAALFMWNLKKKGFKIYVFGQVASLAVTFILFRGVGGIFASYYLAWILIPIVLTALYATRLKKMN
ncbi:MAG: hypothetical protein V4638_06155 [Bacteroidota bacterium]